jgi:hypothetical protein
MQVQMSSLCKDVVALPGGVLQRVLSIAGFILWAASGRTFGYETITVRPVQPWPSLPTNRPTWPYGHLPLLPGLLGPLPVLGGGYTDERALAALDGPIVEIISVSVDGTVLNPSQYTVFDGCVLVRTDGNVWPWQQELTSPPDQVGAFVVNYTRGRALPPSGQVAYGILACELAKAINLDPTCRLPERTQKVSREGIDIEILDPQDFVASGRTGITEVDQWLHAVNPNKITAPMQVWSPDLPYNHRVS